MQLVSRLLAIRIVSRSPGYPLLRRSLPCGAVSRLSVPSRFWSCTALCSAKAGTASTRKKPRASKTTLEEDGDNDLEEMEEEDKEEGGNRANSVHKSVLVTKAELEFVEACKPDVSEAVNYRLHTMDKISEPVRRSIKKHRRLLKYAPSTEEKDRQNDISEVEETLKAEDFGTSFYIRVVDLSDPKSKVLTKCDFKPFVPFDKSKGLAWELGTRIDDTRMCKPFFLYHCPPSTPSTLTPSQKNAMEAIKNILKLHFSSCVIEPIEGEIACDITHYAKYRVLYEQAVIHLRQYEKDLENILQENYIKTFDHYGVNLTPRAEDLQPLTPQAVALRLAAFLKTTIFSSSPETFGVDPSSNLRVVIGIARTAVQAKLACDTEVALLIASKNESKSQLVHVRSFMKHFQKIEDERKFIASFKLEQLPTVNTAFARFMKEVFQVEKVSQIYEKQKELHFSLSPETFKYCWRMVFGRMQFPHEMHSPLFSSSAEHIEEATLLDCATNAITLLNTNRTSLRSDVQCMTCSPGPKGGHVNKSSAQGQKAYGRLASNKNFVETAVEATLGPIFYLFDNHCSTSALSLEDRRLSRRVQWESVSFPRTTDPQIILRVVRHLAGKMAKQRRPKSMEDEDSTLQLCVRLFQLESYSPLPHALGEGVEIVLDELRRVMERRKKFTNSIRRIAGTRALMRKEHVPVGKASKQPADLKRPEKKMKSLKGLVKRKSKN